jgi:tetratricopeptide (TPR) repeat protein
MEDLPMKCKIMTFIVLTLLVLLSACSGNKKVEMQTEQVPVRNPLVLAHQAATSGTDLYNKELYNDAIKSFSEAIDLFTEASATASAVDSIAENIEKMKLNIAKSYIELASESTEMNMYEDALVFYNKALNIYTL